MHRVSLLLWACPWGVPTTEWDTLTPKISKCTHCSDRADQPRPLQRNGQALTQIENQAIQRRIATPACVKACPADALRFGEREQMLTEAHNRISSRPDKYVDHVYGEKEAGGTSVLYLSSVPFEKLGFPSSTKSRTRHFERSRAPRGSAGRPGVGAMLGGILRIC